ncbi:MAG: flagellar motor protein MotB [Oscillospiraceae bacterium]|nr:flagellar motor protein MotB [Oscillospiraceae bacterium]
MKKKGGGGGGANWMDTYGDMVTLLLCFFVLLYSMSTVSEEKWRALVQSFNPSAVQDERATSGNEGPLADETDEDAMGMLQRDPATELGDELGDGTDLLEAIAEEQAALNELAEKLEDYAVQSGMEGSIDITQGDGYVFISFADAVFFGPDSYVLKPEGEQVLAAVSGMLSESVDHIDEVRVLGHTAQASMARPNYPDFDRFLSSNRATVAALYLQENSALTGDRIVSMGFGQHRPIDTNETPEGKAHNRRVEMIITGFDILNEIGDSIQQYTSLREGNAHLTTELPEELAAQMEEQTTEPTPETGGD